MLEYAEIGFNMLRNAGILLVQLHLFSEADVIFRVKILCAISSLSLLVLSVSLPNSLSASYPLSISSFLMHNIYAHVHSKTQ